MTKGLEDTGNVTHKTPMSQPGKIVAHAAGNRLRHFANMAEDSVIGSTSHKREKLHSYTTDFKLEAIKFAEANGNKAAARKFGVDPKTIR